MLGGVRVCIIMSKYKTHKVNEISQQRMCVCMWAGKCVRNFCKNILN